MIDIHTHILFGVDDGCKTIDDSIEQIKRAVSVGVTDIFLTPHYRPTKEYVKSCNEIDHVFTQLNNSIKELNIPITLHRGREVDEHREANEVIKEQTCSSMNNTEYVLVDFGARKCNVDDFIYESSINGYKVIVAHVERYKFVKDMKMYNKYKKSGALLQVNASSIISPRNSDIKKKVRYLLKNQLVDFIATDCHMNPESYPMFEKAYKLVSKKYGSDYANKIFKSNAEEILLKK